MHRLSVATSWIDKTSKRGFHFTLSGVKKRLSKEVGISSYSLLAEKRINTSQRQLEFSNVSISNEYRLEFGCPRIRMATHLSSPAKAIFIGTWLKTVIP